VEAHCERTPLIRLPLVACVVQNGVQGQGLHPLFEEAIPNEVVDQSVAVENERHGLTGGAHPSIYRCAPGGCPTFHREVQDDGPARGEHDRSIHEER
jgi:hypothetical protein